MLKSIYKNIKFKVLNLKHIKWKYFKYVVLNLNNSPINCAENSKKIIVMQTPLHGNLGDQAIAYAQQNFIEQNFPDYEYIEVSFTDVVKKSRNIKEILGSEDIIFIHGGGNLGDMYLLEELTRRFIIQYFEGTKIISFPQTISFSKSRTGIKELERTKSIYNKNENLMLIARESKSYEIMKSCFGENKVLYTPDIVLSLNKHIDVEREGILTCFRNDEEINIKSNFRDNLIKDLREKYGKLTVSDTVVNRTINSKTRENELQQIWGDFQSAEIVLTDRLHGMIFCAITGTPCIVFKNLNHKIEYSYNDWLYKLNYIKFVDVNAMEKPEELLTIIDELKDMVEEKKFTLASEFNPLIQSVRKNVKERLHG